MSKSFKPIFTPIGGAEPQGDNSKGAEEKTNFQAQIEQLLKEKAVAEREIERLKKELELTSGEKKKLERLIARLREELDHKNERLKELENSLKETETLNSMIEKFCLSLKEDIFRTKHRLIGDFVQISKRVLKEFLMSDVLPKEDLVSKVLEEVFREVINIKGSVVVFVNPNYMNKVLEFVAHMKDKAGNTIEIEVEEDSSLKEGEVRIESPKLIVERLNDEALEEIFHEVLRDALEGSQGLREGS